MNPRRSPVQIQNDIRDESRLYLQGKSFQEIAEFIRETRGYDITTRTIASDIHKAHKLWQRSYLSDIDKIKSRELAKIDELERAYWIAWERSQEDKIFTESEKIDDESKSAAGRKAGEYSRKRAKKRTESSYGESKFLDGIQWCVQQRCKILGLNAPEEIHVKDWRKAAKAAGIDNPAEVFNDMVGRFVEAIEDGSA